MSSIGHLLLIASLLIDIEANESIANAFENWDFGNHNSHSYELLIVVILAIFVITLLLLILSLLLKKCFDWWADRDRCKTRDSARTRRGKENWLHKDEDTELESVLIHAELVRMQGDVVPAYEFIKPDDFEIC